MIGRPNHDTVLVRGHRCNGTRTRHRFRRRSGQNRRFPANRFPHSAGARSFPAIAKVGYSKRRRILEIEFVNGAIYRYLNVSASVYRDLMWAQSKARYYDMNIKGTYQSLRVRPRRKEHAEN